MKINWKDFIIALFLSALGFGLFHWFSIMVYHTDCEHACMHYESIFPYSWIYYGIYFLLPLGVPWIFYLWRNREGPLDAVAFVFLFGIGMMLFREIVLDFPHAVSISGLLPAVPALLEYFVISVIAGLLGYYGLGALHIKNIFRKTKRD
jgi:hypothetical protein